MILLAALSLLGRGALQGDSWTIFGKPVVAAAPAPAVTAYPAEVAQWSGWGDLGGAGSTVPVSFIGAGDWSKLLNAPGALPSAVKWQVDVVLLPSVSQISQTDQGNVVQQRYVITQPIKDRIAQGLAMAAAAIQSESGGRLVVNYTTEEDPSLYPLEGDDPGLVAYLSPRFNGGAFEANDKRYRGPFHLCLVLTAGATTVKDMVLNQTPVVSLSVPTLVTSASDFALLALWKFQEAAGIIAGRHGRGPDGVLPVEVTASLFGDVPADQWPTLASLGPVSGKEWQAGMAAGKYGPKGFGEPVAVRAVMSPNATVSASADLLNLKLSGEFAHGGMMLPWNPALKQASGKFLTFRMRTHTPDPVAIGGITNGQMSLHSVLLGKQPFKCRVAAVPVDGMWHEVAVPVKELTADGADGLAIGVYPWTSSNPKLSLVESSYDFADFKLADTAPADAISVTDSAPADWEARATDARTAAKTPDTALDALSRALADPDDNVKLNACDVLTTVKVPGVEEKLSAVVGNINPALTDRALAALANQDSPAARGILQNLIRTGPGTHSKAKAAFYLSRLKDGGGVGLVSGLEGTARDWRDRLDALTALAQRGGPEANLFLRSFLDDSDPQVRLVAVQSLALDDADGIKRVLFLSVNDPYDVVRAASCQKLLQSADADLKKEGYRGTADDSWYTRVLVLNWIAEHPSATDRPALRQAVLSPYGAVRAATLKALAASADPVVTDEVANVLNDADPQVQEALIMLARAKKLALPADTVALLKASASKMVVQAANNLPE